eukprot:3941201-Rhodomonas_salina.4
MAIERTARWHPGRSIPLQRHFRRGSATSISLPEYHYDMRILGTHTTGRSIPLQQRFQRGSALVALPPHPLVPPYARSVPDFA